MLDKHSLDILKKIYRCPYITIAELKLIFPRRDTEEILIWLESEHYISFREASRADLDEGYEMAPYDGAHLLSIRKGNIAAEDTTLLRANIALCISILSLVLSFIAVFLK